MCGRYALGLDSDELESYLDAQLFNQRHASPDEEDNADQLADPRPEQQNPGGGSPREPVASGSGSSAGSDARASGADAKGKGKSSELGLHWDVSAKAAYRPRYNVAPQSPCVVVRTVKSSFGHKEPMIDLMKWGLVPAWVKSPDQNPHHTINCQKETLFTGTGMWAALRDKKRCVIIAQGFYEWLAKGKDKIPHFTKPKNGQLMVMAGLWDSVTYKNSYDPLKTFTIITTPVNKQLSFLHNRMPAILASPAEVALWLSDEPWSPKLEALIRPFPHALECYKVPSEVGKVSNNSPDFIKPIAERKGNIASLFAAQAAASPPAPPRASSSSPARSTAVSTASYFNTPSTSSTPAASSKTKEKKRDRSSSIEIVEPPPKKKLAAGGKKVSDKEKKK